MKIRDTLILIAIALLLAVVSIQIGQWAYSWLPPQASSESQLIDNTISFLVTLGSFIFLGVTGTVLYSVILHRATEEDLTDGLPIEGNITLEVVWTVIPVVLVVWIAGYSYNIYQQMGVQAPGHGSHQNMGMEAAYAASLESPMDSSIGSEATLVENIEVDAKQWAWVFRYPGSNITSTELHLPVNQRIRFALQSEDVIHGFYVPAFRLKQDIVPNENISLEVTPTRIGQYRLSDSQYSGTYFAAMEANVVVESQEDYQKWLHEAARQKPSLAHNQAAQEYAQNEQQEFKNGWKTVPPAAPPLVNYHT
ncbi:MAG: cytochrome c oxidase subunit II [Cyanobacteria bacterium P01_A01_bin.84]